MPGTIAELDGVRALAILAVLGHHTDGIVHGGFLGVDLFFVLSGFLITSLLLAEHDRTGTVLLGHFFARRALRILPPLFVGVVLGVCLSQAGDPARSIPAMLLFYANLLDFHLLGAMSGTWSLSIEEQFYLLWPVAMLQLLRRGMRAAFVVMASVAAVALMVRVSMYLAQFNHEFIYRFTLARADSLAVGCCAALWAKSGRRPPGDATLAWSFVTLCSALWLTQRLWPATMTVGYTLFAMVCAVFILSAIAPGAGPIRGLLRSRVMRYLGRRSYGIYLYHAPIFQAMESLRHSHDVVNFALVTLLRFAATLVMAELSYRTIEAAALSLKGRFAGRGGTAQGIGPDLSIAHPVAAQAAPSPSRDGR